MLEVPHLLPALLLPLSITVPCQVPIMACIVVADVAMSYAVMAGVAMAFDVMAFAVMAVEFEFLCGHSFAPG